MRVRRSLPALAILTLVVLAACSADDGPTAPTGPVPLPVTDLLVTGGADGQLSLRWTSPALPGNAGGGITYDLRHIEPGREDSPWAAWTALPAPGGDTEAGIVHEHTAAGLQPGLTTVLGLRARQGEGPWSATSNLVIATAAADHDRTPPAPVQGLRQWAGELDALTVAWAAAGDDSIYGQAASYEVRWSLAPIDAGNWDQAARHDGPVTPASKPGYLAATIGGLDEKVTHWVAVRAFDDAGHASGLADAVACVADTMRVWYVNVEGTGDTPTIEEAVQLARVGDTVLVAPGRYTWTNQGTGDPHFGLINVPRNHTGFTILSEEGPEATIIDAEREGPCLVITGVVLGPGDEVPDWPGVTVDGFTFTNGLAIGPEGSMTEAWAGAGITMHLNSAHIRNCIVRRNQATQGGGIWYGGQGVPVFENVLVEDNVAEWGGGMVLVNCTFEVLVDRCTIRNNRASRLEMNRTVGAGMLIYNVRAVVRDCLIEGNEADHDGGGLYLAESGHPITLRNTVVRRNEAGHGGGIFVTRAPFHLEGVTLVDNKASGRGGAMMLSRNLGESTITGTTIAGNTGSLGAVTRTENGAHVTITGCLIAGNAGGDAFSSHFGSGFALGCSDVWDNVRDDKWPPLFTDLGGIFRADPLFCGAENYGLHPASPCLPGQQPDGEGCGLVGAHGQGCGALVSSR